MAVAAGSDQRGKILDAALALMSEQGSAGASMRQLAAACGLNVATLYHYFPSKADLLRSVMEERRYGERVAVDPPPLDPALPPGARLTELLAWLWEGALAEEAVWRLLIGEALRGEDVAAQTAAEVVELLAAALEEWLRVGFPELRGDRAAIARVLRAHVFSLVVEHLAVGGAAPDSAHRRAQELAAVIFPQDTPNPSHA